MLVLNHEILNKENPNKWRLDKKEKYYLQKQSISNNLYSKQLFFFF